MLDGRDATEYSRDRKTRADWHLNRAVVRPRATSFKRVLNNAFQSFGRANDGSSLFPARRSFEPGSSSNIAKEFGSDIKYSNELPGHLDNDDVESSKSPTNIQDCLAQILSQMSCIQQSNARLREQLKQQQRSFDNRLQEMEVRFFDKKSPALPSCPQQEHGLEGVIPMVPGHDKD